MPEAALEVFFFGTTPARKLGCFEGPAGGAERQTAVVLCPPWGHEAIRAHRAYRRLSSDLAELGFGVMRFDLSGAGDSEGGEELWRLETWTDDVVEAAAEARGRLGGEGPVCLIGGRLGAALALLAAERLNSVSALVLWDPALSGRAYLADLEREHRRVRATAHLTVPRDRAAEREGERLGFPLPDVLARELEALDLTGPSGRTMARPYLTVNTTALGDAEAPWTWVEDVARAVLPLRAIREITGQIEATCP
jgi:pimeloyl-ACP methyl ester carboxylesterase